MTIFEKGCLVHLAVSSWTGLAKVSTSDIEVHADKNLIKASKFLVDKENLKPIEQVRNDARNYLYSKSLPFPIPGVAFVPKESIPEVNGKLLEFQERFDQEVSAFTDHYNEFIEVARDGLRELFNTDDYPEDITEKFSFQWLFLTVGEANPNTLAPEIYAQEQEKFVHTIESFTANVITLLRTKFGDMINNLTMRLKEGKRFKEASISNLKDFMDEFRNLNVTDDAELALLIDKTQRALGGVTGEALRSDEELKGVMTENLEAIQKEFQEMSKGRLVVY